MILTAVKIFLPAVLAFLVGILITPDLTKLFYRYKLWKKHSRSESGTTTSFQNVHNSAAEKRTPRVGGIIIWVSVLLTTGIIFLISRVFPEFLGNSLEFISRNQTYIPLATLFFASIIGLIDDALQISGKSTYARDAVRYRYVKVGSVILISLFVGMWFYQKLGMSSIAIPFDGQLELGIFFVPFFIIVALATFSTSVIDGIDGLSGGVLAAIFAAYTVIAFFANQLDLAAFNAVVTGALLAFLWFNVPPARFYMGETGMLGLTMTIAAIAFITDTVLILPLIALPLVITSASDIIQMISRSVWKKRVFRVAPLHHHFEAIGWKPEKVVMRYWIIAVISAIIGVIVAVIS